MEVILWLLPYMLIALLIGILAGVVGVYIYTRRLSGIVGGLAHFSLGPIGLAYALQFIIGNSVNFSLFSLCIMVLVALVLPIDAKGRVRADQEIQVLWGVGMALGLLIMFLLPGYLNLDMFLFGSLLTISTTSIISLSIVSILVLAIEIVFHNRLKYLGIDDDLLYLRGIHPKIFHRVQLIIIVVSISILLEAIGILLMIAILTIPAACASLLVIRSRALIWGSMLIASIGLIMGIALSYTFDLQISSIITLLLGLFYFILRIVETTKQKIVKR